MLLFFFSSRRRHTSCLSDWSSDVCSSDLLSSEGIHIHLCLVDCRSSEGDLSNSYVGSNSGVVCRPTCQPCRPEIGRASCREKVQKSVVEVSLKKTKYKTKEQRNKAKNVNR